MTKSEQKEENGGRFRLGLIGIRQREGQSSFELMASGGPAVSVGDGAK